MVILKWSSTQKGMFLFTTPLCLTLHVILVWGGAVFHQHLRLDRLGDPSSSFPTAVNDSQSADERAGAGLSHSSVSYECISQERACTSAPKASRFLLGALVKGEEPGTPEGRSGLLCTKPLHKLVSIIWWFKKNSKLKSWQ